MEDNTREANSVAIDIKTEAPYVQLPKLTIREPVAMMDGGRYVSEEESTRAAATYFVAGLFLVIVLCAVNAGAHWKSRSWKARVIARISLVVSVLQTIGVAYLVYIMPTPSME